MLDVFHFRESRFAFVQFNGQFIFDFISIKYYLSMQSHIIMTRGEEMQNSREMHPPTDQTFCPAVLWWWCGVRLDWAWMCLAFAMFALYIHTSQHDTHNAKLYIFCSDADISDRRLETQTKHESDRKWNEIRVSPVIRDSRGLWMGRTRWIWDVTLFCVMGAICWVARQHRTWLMGQNGIMGYVVNCLLCVSTGSLTRIWHLPSNYFV